jgi:6-phosphogluconolactonase
VSDPVVRRVADAEAVARAAAEEVVRAGRGAIDERGRFTVALSGGSTPRRMYQLLADPDAPFRARLRWDAVHVFFGDERHVSPEHPDSNYRMAREALLDHVPVASVHRIRGELADAGAAAAAYEVELDGFFGPGAGGAPPRLDLVLLGLGADGHTASLFPGSPALAPRNRWVLAPFVEQVRTHRITLTLPVLRRAREVVFLVAGPDKAEALARVLEPAPPPPPLPAARVRPDDGDLVWIVDRAAASRLPELWA